ncbi:MAG: MFS transporter [Synergistetes bacterium]|nr:MFS transporter [Synergistota bacterium]MCX8127896.1 MFS transporter [Synergistota bacterium]MDW8192158.1 MFS transporter [Synergistota bacterium]
MEIQVNKRAILLIAVLTSFIIPFMVSSINIALPTIGREFKMDAILLNWVATAYIISCAVFTVPFGRIADIYGRRKIFLMGLLFYAVFSFLCGTPKDPYFLIVFRILQGIGGAMIFATNIAILTSVFPSRERGKVLGINVASTYSGMSLGPFIGGYLTYCIGWRSIFFIGFALTLLSAFLAFRKVKGEWAEAKNESFDKMGFLLYAFLIVSLMSGFSRVPDISGFALLALGCGIFIFFVLWESRVKYPLLDISLFKSNRVFAFSSLAALIHYSATFAVTFLLSLYLQYIKGLNPRFAGSIIIFQPLMMALFSPIAGRLSDRIEPRIIASFGMGITALGVFLLSFLKEGTAINYIIVSLIVLGFGFAFFSSPNTSAIMGSVERRFYGVASGMVATMRLLGQMFSMGIVMLIFSIYIGRVQITPDKYLSFILSLKTSFLVFTVLCLAAISASLARGNLRVDQRCDR